MSRGWIGVDFDGTLAEYHGWSQELGEPIPLMVKRVKEWLRDGKDVRIFTARVSVTGRKNLQGEVDDAKYAAKVRDQIGAWCEKHLGQRLPVTATKDFEMIELWDDRCVHVEINTGRILG